MLQSKTACFSFKMTHVAWGPIPTMQEIFFGWAGPGDSVVFGAMDDCNVFFSSAMSTAVSTSSVRALGLALMLLLELIELLKAFMFRFPCSFPGSKRKYCFHELVRFIFLFHFYSV